MQKYKSLSDAIALAEFAHRNQSDKSGQPYIDHPMRVLRAVQGQGALPFVQIAAVLHDVTEDTAFTPQMLLDLGFAEPAVELIKLVDRDHSRAKFNELVSSGAFHVVPGYEKEQADKFYYNEIRNNRDASILKLSDIGDNMLPWRLNYFSDETQKRLVTKYTKALAILNPPPVNHGMLTDHVHDPYTLR